jgi:hypothetical protein
MELQAPPLQRHGVQILTTRFQISGQLETIGPPDNFINDSTRDSIALHEAQVTPLTPSSPLGSLSRPHIVVLKSEIMLLYPTSAESRASIQTLTRRELLVAYTPLAVCRGHFHMPVEANLNEFLSVTPGLFLPVTETKIFPLFELPAPFPGEADLLLIGRAHLHLYHPA